MYHYNFTRTFCIINHTELSQKLFSVSWFLHFFFFLLRMVVCSSPCLLRCSFHGKETSQTQLQLHEFFFFLNLLFISVFVMFCGLQCFCLSAVPHSPITIGGQKTGSRGTRVQSSKINTFVKAFVRQHIIIIRISRRKKRFSYS